MIGKMLSKLVKGLCPGGSFEETPQQQHVPHRRPFQVDSILSSHAVDNIVQQVMENAVAAMSYREPIMTHLRRVLDKNPHQAHSKVAEGCRRSATHLAQWGSADVCAMMEWHKIIYDEILAKGNHTPPTPQKDNIKVSTHFFPSEASFQALLKTIQSSRQTLDICVFSLTDDDLANAILNAYKRGVRVRLIADDDQTSTKGSDVLRLKSAGIPVKLDNNTSHMHNKFAVVDGSILLNGSYNWTKAARNANRENIVIMEHGPTVRDFQQEFNKLWSVYSS